MLREGKLFGRVRHKHIAQVSEANKILARSYLDHRSRSITDGIPNFDVVVLDETYCHLGHNNEATWYDPEFPPARIRYDKGPRLNVIGAGFYRVEGGVLVGGLVQESLEIWYTTSSGARKGRPPKDSVKLVAYEASKTRFQGNADSDIFETWSSDVLELLPETRGGVICMDNVKIHKRQEYTKADALRWLREKGLSFPNEISKSKLKGLLKEHNVHIRFKVVQMAEVHGYGVVFTTPYCPWHDRDLLGLRKEQSSPTADPQHE